ncbi:MAG: energy transducer TonB [Acidobacteriota bacterium]|nr:MAG: energy transducer TonB [Acidobacteriota bacterium]
MFNTLVESTRKRDGRRTGRYFALTTVIYGLGLVGLAIGTIVGFSPVLAEEYTFESMLAPPPSAPPKFHARIIPRQPAAAPNVFAPPSRPATKALPASELKDRPPVITGSWVPGGSTGGEIFEGSGIPGGRTSIEVIPPPPAPKATPPPVDEPKRHQPLQISKGVLQGKAIRKVKPQYSAIARQVRASGAVQVLVTISEEGRVIEAAAIEGHPMLRSVAVEAARQWIFSPTMLSGVPVRVQGVLTFNFTLQ